MLVIFGKPMTGPRNLSGIFAVPKHGLDPLLLSATNHPHLLSAVEATRPSSREPLPSLRDVGQRFSFWMKLEGEQQDGYIQPNKPSHEPPIRQFDCDATNVLGYPQPNKRAENLTTMLRIHRQRYRRIWTPPRHAEPRERLEEPATTARTQREYGEHYKGAVNPTTARRTTSTDTRYLWGFDWRHSQPRSPCQHIVTNSSISSDEWTKRGERAGRLQVGSRSSFEWEGPLVRLNNGDKKLTARGGDTVQRVGKSSQGTAGPTTTWRAQRGGSEPPQ